MPTIEKVYVRDVIALDASTSCQDAAHLMQAHSTRHLLVKQGDSAVGVVSMINVLSLMLEDNRWLIEQLHTYIRGGRGG